MHRVLLFVTAIILCGIGGMAGSILGNGLGKTGLWVGGIVGGLVASVAVAAIAGKAKWISRDRQAATAIGTAVGFLAAAAIAVNTLSSPIGPVLSTTLAGIGALIGARNNKSSV
ncbi:MAG TPA: hypothetical protein VF042_15690 [Gemmatimonadaceae bacterium]